jgi:CheY-like chemotaxis protein
MTAILICSQGDLSRQIQQTLLGRGGVDRYKASGIDELRVLGRALCPSLILIDAAMPEARECIQLVRGDPGTRDRSIAVVVTGEFDAADADLLRLGANAILRPPPDATWDERLARLLSVSVRQDWRLPVQLTVEANHGAETFSSQALNLSVTGMLLESAFPLALHQEFDFRFQVPDGSPVAGRARVVRQPSRRTHGVEFLKLEGESKNAIRQFVRSAAVGRSAT